ncbi:cytosine-specific methyltransferase NlaX (M.NlaX), partial [human gut metagenome]
YDENGKVEQHLEQGNREYSNTITTVTKDNVVIEKNNKPERVGQISSDGSQCGMVYSDDGLFPTLSAGCHGYANPHIYTQYRIRKLTPVECGRLMGVNMDDIIRMIIADHRRANEYLQYMKDNGIEYEGKKEMDELSKIQGMSNSKLYKQYGNSIVVDVMCAMFRNLNIKGVENWNNYCKNQAKK